MDQPDILIIGAGVAGLSAGCYAQMNGFRTRILEMHEIPGGLCTAWKRGGYTIDGCIHWLVGSSPKSGMYRFWEEVGIAKDRKFIDLEEYMRFEFQDGRILHLWGDVDRLEKELLAFSPADAKLIREFTAGIRMAMVFDPVNGTEPAIAQLRKGLAVAWTVFSGTRGFKKWLRLSAGDFADRFRDPALRTAFREMWFPEFSMFFMLATFAWMHQKNAAYPIGGSLPLALSMARRYKALGGEIQYKTRVAEILVENARAVGVRLEDGSELRAARVISAADGHQTIFGMLGGRFVDDEIKNVYDTWKPFPPLLYVGLGINRSFENEAKTITGISFDLKKPVMIGEKLRERLSIHLFNQDPTFAPAGKTSAVVVLESEYDFWKKLSENREEYVARKDGVGRLVVDCLEERFPGIREQVEVVDVSTPLAFERYTGNWRGSFEGWLLTPENAHTLLRPMKQTFPGLVGAYLCGHWVEPGGGLPTCVMSARRLMKAICKETGRKFTTTID